MIEKQKRLPVTVCYLRACYKIYNICVCKAVKEIYNIYYIVWSISAGGDREKERQSEKNFRNKKMSTNFFRFFFCFFVIHYIITIMHYRCTLQTSSTIIMSDQQKTVQKYSKFLYYIGATSRRVVYIIMYNIWPTSRMMLYLKYVRIGINVLLQYIISIYVFRLLYIITFRTWDLTRNVIWEEPYKQNSGIVALKMHTNIYN